MWGRVIPWRSPVAPVPFLTVRMSRRFADLYGWAEGIPLIEGPIMFGNAIESMCRMEMIILDHAGNSDGF